MFPARWARLHSSAPVYALVAWHDLGDKLMPQHAQSQSFGLSTGMPQVPNSRAVISND